MYVLWMDVGVNESIYVNAYASTDGWMDGRTDGGMDGWMDRRTDGDGWMEAWMDGEAMGGWKDGQVHGSTDGWTDGWMDGLIHGCMNSMVMFPPKDCYAGIAVAAILTSALADARLHSIACPCANIACHPGSHKQHTS